MVWDVFFQSRSRGISIERHFPWLTKDDQNTWFVGIRDGEELVGGLVVRGLQNNDDTDGYKIGSVGLVCVANKYCGQGNARRMLEAAINEARLRDYDALTLWTRQHDVYTSSGFVLKDDAVFGSLSMVTMVRGNSDVRPLLSFNELAPELGLPAFAFGGKTISTVGATAHFVFDGSGDILVDWSGDDNQVIQILMELEAKNLRINAHQGDSLLEVLRASGAVLNMLPTNLQMWLTLRSELSGVNWLNISRFSVLDRI